jgi:nicotinamidase-related amidase
MIDLNGAVLLPIDMQQGFDQSTWPKRWNNSVDSNGLDILAAWRRAAKPIIHVQHNSIENGSSLNPDNIGNEFRPGFVPVGDERKITKSVNSAFVGTELELQLRRIKAQSIVTFGISTDMCVSTTVRMGANLGWSMVLVEDACDCFELKATDGRHISARDVHVAHVATLGFEFCKVITTRELIEAL